MQITIFFFLSGVTSRVIFGHKIFRKELCLMRWEIHTYESASSRKGVSYILPCALYMSVCMPVRVLALSRFDLMWENVAILETQIPG